MAKKKPIAADHFLIEYFDGKFNLLIDGYMALDKKINDLRAEMSRRFEEINQHLELHDDQFEVVFEELHRLREEMAGLKV